MSKTRQSRHQHWRMNAALTAIVSALLTVSAMASPASAQKNADGNRVIKWSGNGFRLEMQALAHDRVLAFFIGRGFPASEARFVAQTGCVFRSAMGNAGTNATDPPITIPLVSWRTIVDGKKRAPIVREKWDAIWQKRGADPGALVGFYWALYPTEQSYKPTDYNWGMISFGLPPGTIFDLEVRWRVGETEHVKQFKDLECGK